MKDSTTVFLAAAAVRLLVICVALAFDRPVPITDLFIVVSVVLIGIGLAAY